MNLARILCLAMLCVAAAIACSGPSKVNSTASLKRAYWGLPQDGLGADVTGRVTCPNGFPCDTFANAAAYGDPRPDTNKRLTLIWACEPQRLVLSEVVISGLKVRMDCIAGPQIVPRTISILEATWGSDGASSTADVTGRVTCPDGFPCDVFANAANFGDARPDTNKRLTVIWTCQPQRLVLSEIVISSLKTRMDCIGGAPAVPRTISIVEATWGSDGAGSAVDVTRQVRDICGEDSTRCQIPAMAYVFGMPDRNPKMLRIRFTCNGQTTPGQQSLENGVADLRCERAADLGY